MSVMNVQVSNHIQAPIDAIWRLVAEDFTSIQTWSASVVTSKPLEVPHLDGAPSGGRVCTFTDDPDGFAAREAITEYNPASFRLGFDVEPINPPAALPIRRNHVVVELEAVDDGTTRLTWTASPELKPVAYLLYPVVKAAMRKSFQGIIDELKAYAEQGHHATGAMHLAVSA